MKPQTLVKGKTIETGKFGVVIRSDFGHDAPGSVDVVFDGRTYSQEVMPEDLEIIGPENAIADFKKCGGGRGKECCRFLAVDADGFSCERFGTLRTSIQFKSGMVAKRNPSKLYPECQLED